MAKIKTEEEKLWAKTAEEIAAKVVGIFPTMNEHALRARLYNFFEQENGPGKSVYSDANFYYIHDVASILETAFDPTSGDDDSMMVTSEVKWAFDQLSDTYQYRIMERYLHGVIRPSGSPERDQLYRAINRLTDILNKWDRRPATIGHEGPGAREVWSNAKAHHEIHRDYSPSSGGGGYGDTWDF